MLKINPPHILPTLFTVLSIVSLVLKKTGMPFASLLAMIVFDGMAVLFFLNSLAIFKRGEKILYNIHSIIYLVATFALLYRLQNWNGWQILTNISFIAILLYSIFIIRTIKNVLKTFNIGGLWVYFYRIYLPWLFFLVMISISFFTNPRQFHSLFNSGTYEQYVRLNYSPAEGTTLLDLYKPQDETSAKKANSYFDKAKELESKGEYEEALPFYDKCIDLNPAYAEAIERRGFLKLTHLELSREMAADAIADFTRAIELKPDLAAAYYHRAMANEFLRPHERSLMVNDLLKVIDLDSSYKSDKFVVRYFK